jgi:8-oxo-dGTP pyrophosphatase MutT (NUDIX family)
MVKEKYRKAVFIVVYRKIKSIFGREKVKYLLLKRKKHWIGWEFPKGGIDGRERAIETAKREIFEECGQKGSNLKEYNFSGKYRYHKKLKDRPGFIGQTFKLFSAEVKNRKCKIDAREHSTYRWASYEKAVKRVKFENKKKSLEIVNREIIKK